MGRVGRRLQGGGSIKDYEPDVKVYEADIKAEELGLTAQVQTYQGRIEEVKKVLGREARAVRFPGRQRWMVKGLVENYNAEEVILKAVGRPLLAGWEEISTAL
jgi:hypothetical protein